MTDTGSNFRPDFSNCVRDLAPELARIAVFVIPIGYGMRDGREALEKTVASCEGARCEITGSSPGTRSDAVFPGARGRSERVVCFLHNSEGPPEGTAHGYAMTVHKAQGSQFDHVILVTDWPDRFVSRASVYTAVSRARKRLTIVGDETELAECAEREGKARRTYLSLMKGS